MDPRERLRSFLLDEFGADLPREKLTDDFPLIDGGVVDSLGIFQLMAFIEGEYGVDIDDVELVYDNFRDLDSIARLILSKVGAAEHG